VTTTNAAHKILRVRMRGKVQTYMRISCVFLPDGIAG
jgi:hypothetical protein